MLIRFALADQGFRQPKMWAKIFSYWPEGIVGFIAWLVIVYFSLKTFEEFNIRKQRRRYKEEDDIGRRQKEDTEESEAAPGKSQSGVRVSKAGKRKLQKSVEHAKQELIQSGAGRGNPKNRRATRGSK